MVNEAYTSNSAEIATEQTAGEDYISMKGEDNIQDTGTDAEQIVTAVNEAYASYSAELAIETIRNEAYGTLASKTTTEKGSIAIIHRNLTTLK
jgi:hypothetical protein